MFFVDATLGDLCRFLQPGLIICLIISMTFEKKLDLSNVKHERMYKLIMGLVPSNWKRMLRTEISQISVLKTF